MSALLPTTARAAVWTMAPTDDPVAFISVDDGYDEDPAAAEFVEAGQVPLTAFVTYYAAVSSYPPTTTPHVEYLRRFRTGGHKVECHSKTHTDLATLDAATQLADVGKARDWLARPEMFGAVPTLFRPPYGGYNDDTLAALAAKGFKTCLLWSHAVEDLAADPTLTIRRGEIILCHFTTTLLVDLQLALARIAAAGLSPAWLADYVR